MAVYKSKGIVLRSIRYSEADRILDLYTTEAGLVSAIAKGIRRTKSRFGARLEPLSCVDFVAYHGRTLDTVTQAETLRSFHGIREDLARFETAAGMVGSVRALSGGTKRTAGSSTCSTMPCTRWRQAILVSRTSRLPSA